MSKLKPVPDAYHTVTPYLSLKDAHKAIEFYRRAFGAEERFRMPTPDGKVAHAEIMIGNSILMVSEAVQEPTSASLYLYVPDADAVFARAVSAGAHADLPLADMFWGDRYGRVTDPFGIRWGIATHKEDVSQEEINRRASQAFQSACALTSASASATCKRRLFRRQRGEPRECPPEAGHRLGDDLCHAPLPPWPHLPPARVAVDSGRQWA